MVINTIIYLNKLENKLRASYLILYGVVYSEEYMTQFLDIFIPKTITTLIINESDSKTAQKAT